MTPKASYVVPLSTRDEPFIEYEVLVVGAPMVTVGRVLSVPDGGGVVLPLPLVEDVVIVHVKDCDVLKTPSEARAVTEYVPAVVPVPEM